MGKQRRALGRGLDALISSAGPRTQEIPLEDIVPGKSQPRTVFDDATLAELADSIRVHGIIQPLLVGRADERGKHLLIAGERRWQAARMAGLDAAPVVIRDAEPRQAVELALVENIQRQDLSPLEEAAAFQQLVRDYGLTQEEIASRVGRSRPAIANTLRLLTLPSSVRDALASGTITEGHARALLGFDDQALMEQALARVVSQSLNVRQTEQLVAAIKSGSRPRRVPSEKPQEIASLEEDLRRSLGTKVSVVRGRKSGRIVIEYYSDEELTALADRLLSKP